MRNQNRVQEVNLRTTLKLYHPFESNEGKPKPTSITHHLHSKVQPFKTPTQTNFNTNPSIKNNFYFEMEANYKMLHRNLQNEYKFFVQACLKVKQATQSYYDEVIEIVNDCRISAMADLEIVFGDGHRRLQSQLKDIANALQEIYSGHSKKSTEQMNAQFSQLSVLEMPVFRVETNNQLKEFEVLMQELKLNVISVTHRSQSPSLDKQNISIQQPSCMNLSNIKQSRIVKMKKSQISHNSAGCREHEQGNTHENTVKKTNGQNYYNNGNSGAHNYAANTQDSIGAHSNQNTNVGMGNMCEFSCEEEFEWNPDDINSHKYDKKQIVSEIIMEEPSSCEDSLMLSEVP